jgi:hypothetical protein
MSAPVMPSDRRTAEEAKRLLQEIAGPISAVYRELLRLQDGDADAAGRVSELVGALFDQVGHLRDLATLMSGRR